MTVRYRRGQRDRGIHALVGSIRIQVGMTELQTYWGIRCRTCLELIPFGICPAHTYGPGSAMLRPGIYECSQGHEHTYFAEDIRFFRSGVPVTDAHLVIYKDKSSLIQPVSKG